MADMICRKSGAACRAISDSVSTTSEPRRALQGWLIEPDPSALTKSLFLSAPEAMTGSSTNFSYNQTMSKAAPGFTATLDQLSRGFRQNFLFTGSSLDSIRVWDTVLLPSLPSMDGVLERSRASFKSSELNEYHTRL